MHEINAYTVGHLMFDKGVKNTHGERIISSINGAGKLTFRMWKKHWNLTTHSVYKNQLIMY